MEISTVLKHVGSSGVGGILSAVVVFQIMAADIEQANTRADTAAQSVAEMKGVLKGMDANLKLFMQTWGVQPIDSGPPDTVFIPIVVPDSAGSN